MQYWNQDEDDEALAQQQAQVQQAQVQQALAQQQGLSQVQQAAQQPEAQQQVIDLLQQAITLIKAQPNAGESVHLRWYMYQLLQAQQGDGEGALYKELRCSIHLGLMGECGSPHTLPCGHTFCYGCLQSLFAISSSSSSSTTCPDCRQALPSSIQALRPNIAVKAIVERLLPRQLSLSH
jgi:hypothetical protein